MRCITLTLMDICLASRPREGEREYGARRYQWCIQILNLARLITQEIALMKNPKNPRQAFERQSKLLKDAFVRDGFALQKKSLHFAWKKFRVFSSIFPSPISGG